MNVRQLSKRPLSAGAVAAAVIVALAMPVLSRAQPTTTAPAATTDPTVDDLTRLKTALQDANNKGDVDQMLKFLHPDVLVIFPDGETVVGREALKGYYAKMLAGSDPVVKKYTADPAVDGRQFRGDVDLSWGRMNDRYELNDGTSFALDSRFTATLLKSPDGPPESGGWMIRSFHYSTDAFDNPVLMIAAKRSAIYAGVVAAVVGVIVGVIAGRLSRRRGNASPETAGG